MPTFTANSFSAWEVKIAAHHFHMIPVLPFSIFTTRWGGRGPVEGRFPKPPSPPPPPPSGRSPSRVPTWWHRLKFNLWTSLYLMWSLSLELVKLQTKWEKTKHKTRSLTPEIAGPAASLSSHKSYITIHNFLRYGDLISNNYIRLLSNHLQKERNNVLTPTAGTSAALISPTRTK